MKSDVDSISDKSKDIELSNVAFQPSTKFTILQSLPNYINVQIEKSFQKNCRKQCYEQIGLCAVKSDDKYFK